MFSIDSSISVFQFYFVRSTFSGYVCVVDYARRYSSVRLCALSDKRERNKNSSGDEIANVLVNDDIAHT